ncbi:hypothetical protein [Sporosarcina sp. FSL K6-3457]|uniref:hypothetical protein n=1 Tax=Sporosarcina sp. FSL K6-3457 TaxID=2978204 RepID=UPI0030F8CDE7
MKTVKIKKKNRILHVETSRLASFLNQGYDQIDEDGKVIKLATGGRTVSLPEHNKVIEELEALTAELETLRADGSGAELEKANEDIKALKAKVKKLEDAAKSDTTK